MRPSSHAPSTPPLQAQPSPVQGGGAQSRRCRCPPHRGLPARSDSRQARHRSSPGHRRCNRSPRRCTVEARTGPRAGTSRPHRESPRRPGSRPARYRSCPARRRCSRIPGRCRAAGRIAPLAHRYPRHRESTVHPGSRPTPRRSCPARHRCTRTPGRCTAGCTAASVWQVPGPPGVPVVPQQISPASQGDWVPVVQSQPSAGAGGSGRISALPAVVAVVGAAAGAGIVRSTGGIAGAAVLDALIRVADLLRLAHARTTRYIGRRAADETPVAWSPRPGRADAPLARAWRRSGRRGREHGRRRRRCGRGAGSGCRSRSGSLLRLRRDRCCGMPASAPA